MNTGFDGTLAGLDQPVFVNQLFDAQVRATPHLTALRYNEKSLSYEELNKQANALAMRIAQAQPSANIVGISTTRGIDTIVGVLAILKSGKAYLPLDTHLPPARLQQIVADSGIEFCLAPIEEQPLFKSLGLKCEFSVDSQEAKSVQQSMAYVLYTSGSTGKPKGVCMGHSALVNLLQWQQKNSIATIGTNTLQFAPLSFDVSFQEIFTTLTTGGTLVLMDETLKYDHDALLGYIEKNQITRLFLPFVALQYLTAAAAQANSYPQSLKEVITAGEQLKVTPDVTIFFNAIKGSKLHNQYGPTECHVVTELILSGNSGLWPDLPSIGKAIDNTAIYILDSHLNLLPNGQTGELCIAGLSLAEGYLNRPDLTAEKFIYWQHPTKGSIRIYRTGDLARVQEDGNIEFLGREDSQVKIRGYRIELGEIEVALNQLPHIKQAVVIARNDRRRVEKYLAAYLISADGNTNTTNIRNLLMALLPDYMVPSAFTWLDELPMTPSGKIDAKALPKPELKRPELAVRYKAPITVIEKRIAAIWTDIVNIDDIGIDDNFFELGGNSLLAMKAVTTLKQTWDYRLPIIKLYQYPTISGIVGFLNGKERPELQLPKQREHEPNKDVAVIGMSGRFPGADTIDELWDVLKEGRETIRFFTKEELSAHIPSAIKNDPDYVRARGIVNRADEFDAAFFNINPKVAELMDPQHRVFLEIAWEVLESTGHLPQHYEGLVGVFAGTGNNTYYPNNVWPNQNLVENVGGFQAMAVNEKDYIATRTAYALDLKGPAISVHAACSTSLLAIAQAVESIRAGKCDVAIAGGVSITSPINSGYQYKEGAMLSPDGHCRPFDAESKGTVFSDGAGVVLLKSLEDAKRGGDYIYGVIKGVGVNNDGGAKGNFFAPSIIGQASAIATAIADAGVDPAAISYVEAHGTATPIGDPIEIEGLKAAFNIQAGQSTCAIGSIKSNMGHLTAAAGVAGLIKTLLAMRYKQLPPSINFNSLNQNIDLGNSPFYVNDKLADWQPEGKRIAGVSSFGVGGTNVHVLVEEFENQISESTSGRPLQLITWSAQTQASLDIYGEKLADSPQRKTIELADVAFSLQTTRQDFNYRWFVVAADQHQLSEAVKNTASNTKNLTESIKEIAFMFPGQDSRYVNMCRDLYQHEIVFKQAADECAEILKAETGIDILSIIYPVLADEQAEAQLSNTLYTQPAIFTTQYAMAKLWMSWGIMPNALVGHSIGELVAAHLAGIFSLNDALKFVAARSRLMSALPPGNMLAVRLNEVDIQQWLIPGADIAGVNSSGTCVLSGPVDVISKLADTFAENNIAAKVLNTSHAFHSAMLDPIIEPLREVLQSIKLNAPRVPMASTVTGNWIKDAEAISPEYWVQQLRQTVRFADAIVTLQDDESRLMLEVGVGGVTTAHARQSIKIKKVTAITSLDNTVQNQGDYQSILKALGQLWLNGVNPNWQAFYAGQNRNRVELPAYAFDRKRYWVDPPVTPQNLVSIQYTQQDNPLIDIENNEAATAPNSAMEQTNLINRLKQILEDASGIDTSVIDPETSFIEMGMDSLLLTQLTLTLKKEFGQPLTFRQLNDGLHNLDLLSAYLGQNLPAQPAVSTPQVVYASPQAYPSQTNKPADNSALGLIAQQLEILSKQVSLMQSGQPIANTQPVTTFQPTPASEVGPDILPEEVIELKKPFGATARIERKSTELNAKQAAFLAKLTKAYNQKTAGSKSYTQQHRAYMADPRVVSGFKPQTKELTYSIVVDRSKGSRLWDIDGNKYVDALNGFGSNMFGYQPDVTKNAILAQIEKGYEIGPQHVLAGEVCKLICEFTDFDRSALCNTGSEAVLGAMRIARTVTGRSLIVAFTGSYHGIVDEVIVRGTKKLKSFPAAPGIMPEAVQNMLILDYGTDESLRIIKERAAEIAAVLVEPVQSRRPEFQPIEFLRNLRIVTQDTGVVLVFDEVITGFRAHPGGAQAMFGVKADLATYGKVIGGGMPIGAIAGKGFVMDALDGGFWQFGDESVPEAGVTYFAGTFVRHPLALAAAKASLLYMKAEGPGLQRMLNDNTTYLAGQLNGLCEKYNLPLHAVHFGSLWKLKFDEEIPYGELLFTLMRYKGVHISDGFPCFLTEAHTKEDIDFTIKCFKESAIELIDAQIFENGFHLDDVVLTEEEAPVPGAKLGRDKDGNPGWFIPDPENVNAYLKIERSK
jgi:amino acid adenylation domain-containing protein